MANESAEHNGTGVQAETLENASQATQDLIKKAKDADRSTLERMIRGAERRTRMPGAEGKRAKQEAQQLKNIFGSRFKGVVRRTWDSVPPPRKID